MFKRIRKYAAVAVIAAAPLATILSPAVAHAATITWSGADCPATNCNWSNVNNWTGGVVPGAADTAVIDNAAVSTSINSPVVDTPVTITNLMFTNNSAGAAVNVKLGADLTITGAVTQAASVTATSNAIISDGSARSLIMGNNVQFTLNGQFAIGTGGNVTMSLGANTISFNETTTTGVLATIDAVVTGTGGLVFDAPHSAFQLGANNTYSGPTHLINTASTGVAKTSTGNANPFGTSTVTIEPGASAHLKGYSASTTISNPFIITGTTNGSPVVSMSFDDDGTTSGVVLAVPAITLNGDTRLANDSITSTPLRVNLAGITANGHCVQYIGYAPNGEIDGASNGFDNGPAACVLSASTTSAGGATAPDTGFKLVAAHPGVTLGVTLATAGAIYGAARMTRKSASRR